MGHRSLAVGTPASILSGLPSMTPSTQEGPLTILVLGVSWSLLQAGLRPQVHTPHTLSSRPFVPGSFFFSRGKGQGWGRGRGLWLRERENATEESGGDPMQDEGPSGRDSDPSTWGLPP